MSADLLQEASLCRQSLAIQATSLQLLSNMALTRFAADTSAFKAERSVDTLNNSHLAHAEWLSFSLLVTS